MRKILLSVFIVLCAGFAALAIESSKPDTHTNAWGVMHGKQARVKDKECVVCHTDRLECIQCHEDVKPRNHTATWTAKSHGLESRWNKNSCQTCHQEEFCSECHETALPMSHKVHGYGPSSWVTLPLQQTNPASHCMTSCQVPIGRNWNNIPNKNCLLCHRTNPSPANHN